MSIVHGPAVWIFIHAAVCICTASFVIIRTNDPAFAGMSEFSRIDSVTNVGLFRKTNTRRQTSVLSHTCDG